MLLPMSCAHLVSAAPRQLQPILFVAVVCFHKGNPLWRNQTGAIEPQGRNGDPSVCCAPATW